MDVQYKIFKCTGRLYRLAIIKRFISCDMFVTIVKFVAHFCFSLYHFR